jgi:Protein of unknown function (DUF3592)
MVSAHSISWHEVWRFGHVWIYLLKWPLAFVAGWGSIYISRWRKTRRENAAQGWPSVEGRIQGGKVSPIPKTSRFLATLTYSYFIEEYRSGEYVHEFTQEDDADNFVRQMKDKSVQIRYNQSNPNKSVLEQRAIEQHIQLAPRFG